MTNQRILIITFNPGLGVGVIRKPIVLMDLSPSGGFLQYA